MKFDLSFVVHDANQEQDREKNLSSSSKQYIEERNRVSLFDLALPTVSSVGSQSTMEHPFPPHYPSESGASVESTRSSSIPLPSSHIQRTQSELQLDMDEAAAEEREMTMFYRVVNGLRERRRTPTPSHCSQGNGTRTKDPTIHVACQEFPHLVPQYQPHNATTSNWQTSVPIASTSRHVSDSCADEWSITGFEGVSDNPAQQFRRQVQMVEQDPVDSGEDNGIFDIEL